MTVSFSSYHTLSTTLRAIGHLVDAVSQNKEAFFVIEGGGLKVSTDRISGSPVSDALVAKLFYLRIKNAHVISLSEEEFRKDRFKIIGYLRDREAGEGVQKSKLEIGTYLYNLFSYLKQVHEEHAQFLEHPFAAAIDRAISQSPPDAPFLSSAAYTIFLQRQARTLFILRDQIYIELDTILKRNPAICPSEDRQRYLLRDDVLDQLGPHAKELYFKLITEVEQENFLSDQVFERYRHELKDIEKKDLIERPGAKQSALHALLAFANSLIWIDALKRNAQEIERRSQKEKNVVIKEIKEKFSNDRFFEFCTFNKELPVAPLNQKGIDRWERRIKIYRAYNKNEETDVQDTIYELMFNTVQNYAEDEALKTLPNPAEFADLRSEKKMWTQFFKTCRGIETYTQIRKEAEKEVADEKRKEERSKKSSTPPKSKKKKKRELPQTLYEDLKTDENTKPNVLNEASPPPPEVLSAPAAPLEKSPSKVVEPPALTSPFKLTPHLKNWFDDPKGQLKLHREKNPEISPEKVIFDHQAPIMLDVIADRFGHHIMFDRDGKNNPAIVLSCVVRAESIYKAPTRSLMTFTFKAFRKESTFEMDNLVLYHRSLSQSINMSWSVLDYELQINETVLQGKKSSSTTFDVADLIGKKAVDGSFVECYDEEKQCLRVQHPLHKATFEVFLTDKVKKNWS